MKAFRSNCFRLIACAWPEIVTQLPEERDGFVDIICAHGVHSPEMLRHGLPPTSSKSIESFKANLEILARNREVIQLQDAARILKEGILSRKRYAVLTFDDSLACTSRLAIPEVARVGIPATVFVSTEILNTGQAYWWLRLDYSWRHAKADRAVFFGPEGEKVVIRKGDPHSHYYAKTVLWMIDAYQRDLEVARVEEAFGVKLTDPASEYAYAEAMTWDEVRALAVRGVDIGSHTVTHPNLELLGRDELVRELGESKVRIERELGAPCLSFSYPYGKFSPEVTAHVREAGYQCATSTISPGRNLAGQDPFRLMRFSITSEAYRLGYELCGFPRLIKGARPQG